VAGKVKRKLGRRQVDRQLDERIGTLLRQRRVFLGWSQSTLGGKLGLTFQQIQKYERGANQLSVARLIQVCGVLDVPVTYFLDGVNKASAPIEFDYRAARLISGVQPEAVRVAMLRLAAECQKSESE